MFIRVLRVLRECHLSLFVPVCNARDFVRQCCHITSTSRAVHLRSVSCVKHCPGLPRFRETPKTSKAQCIETSNAATKTQKTCGRSKDKEKKTNENPFATARCCTRVVFPPSTSHKNGCSSSSTTATTIACESERSDCAGVRSKPAGHHVRVLPCAAWISSHLHRAGRPASARGLGVAPQWIADLSESVHHLGQHVLLKAGSQGCLQGVCEAVRRQVRLWRKFFFSLPQRRLCHRDVYHTQCHRLVL